MHCTGRRLAHKSLVKYQILPARVFHCSPAPLWFRLIIHVRLILNLFMSSVKSRWRSDCSLVWLMTAFASSQVSEIIVTFFFFLGGTTFGLCHRGIAVVTLLSEPEHRVKEAEWWWFGITGLIEARFYSFMTLWSVLGKFKFFWSLLQSVFSLLFTECWCRGGLFNSLISCEVLFSISIPAKWR